MKIIKKTSNVGLNIIILTYKTVFTNTKDNTEK